MWCILPTATVSFNKCDQFHGLSAFLVESRLCKYSNFAGPSTIASPTPRPMIQTFLALLNTYSQILIFPAYQAQCVDIYFLKGDGFPIMVVFCVCLWSSAWYPQRNLSSSPALKIASGKMPSDSHLPC